MKVLQQLVLYCILFFGSIVAGYLLLLNIDPFQAEIVELAAFYVTAFLFFSSFFILLSYLFRRLIKPKSTKYVCFINSRRQGFLLGLLIVVSLFLQAFNWLNLLTAVPLAVVIILSEFYLQQA